MSTATITYQLLYRDSPQHIPKIVRGASGREYGSTHWRQELFAHVLELSQEVYESRPGQEGAGIDIGKAAINPNDQFEMRCVVDTTELEAERDKWQAECAWLKQKFHAELTAESAKAAGNAITIPAPEATSLAAPVLSEIPQIAVDLSERVAAKFEEQFSDPEPFSRSDFLAMAAAPGGFRKLRKIALDAGLVDADLPKTAAGLVEALTNHFKLAA